MGEENRNQESEEESCWIKRTGLEKGLIWVLIGASALISTLVVTILLYTKPTGIPTDGDMEICETPTCLRESARILESLNFNTDPCEDFYSFSCNLTQSEDGSEKMEELYTEPVSEDDHDLVAVFKRLYEACIDENEASKATLLNVKKSLKSLGGWPVVEGKNWNEDNFHWVEMSWKLRDLGYPHTSLLDVSLDSDPRNKTRYIYKITIPDVKDVRSDFFDASEPNRFMSGVAVAFGAEERRASSEMIEILQFLKDLQWKSNDVLANYEKPLRLTVSEIQRRHDSVDWLEFINKIVGPQGKVLPHDFILFPGESAIDNWLAVIMKESKRIQANYMLWRMVEMALPFLSTKLEDAGLKPKLVDNESMCQTRGQFCISKIHNAFFFDPIDFVFARRHCPEGRLEAFRQLTENFKQAFADTIDNADWMDIKSKEKIVKTIRGATFNYGEDYFSDEILDYAHFTLNSSIYANFFSAYSLTNKNTWDVRYGIVKRVDLLAKIYDLVDYYYYHEKNNIIVLPLGFISEDVFDHNRPDYLNYANVGINLKYIWFEMLKELSHLSVKSKKALENKLKCVYEEKKSSNISNSMVEEVIIHSLATKLAYDAYVKVNGENDKYSILPLFDMAPKYMFWLASATYSCRTNFDMQRTKLTTNELEGFVSLLSKMTVSNTNYQEDFECGIDDVEETSIQPNENDQEPSIEEESACLLF